MSSYVLVTGGAGYIGSHTVVELINNNYKVIIVDNLTNSSYDSISRLQILCKQPILFFDVDLNDTKELSKIFDKYKIDSVLHFAALKAVGESTKIPLDYYYNNVNGTVSLLQVMKSHDVKKIVFSSSATVYGDATRFENMIPIPEHCPTGPTNPYGNTKLTIENIIRDVFKSDQSWKSAILRYFNPIGAHPSGLIGEDPLGIPNNLLPFLAQVAIGRREKLFIFGNDYDSKDGTPIRDYIHVVDLAKGHIAALNYLNKESQGLCREWNLGTGNGSTVIEVYNAFCKAIGKQLPYEIVGRRDGDVLNLTAVPTLANTELKWFAELSIDEACKDLWNWTTKNPFGFNIPGYEWKQYDHDSSDFNNRLHTLTSSDGKFKFSVSNYGAAIVDTSLNNVKLNLGFEDSNQYLQNDNPFFGATIGRVANRIRAGLLKVDNKTIKLEGNENGNTLHGGNRGFDKQYFLGPSVQKTAEGILTMEFLLIDKEQPNLFPGDLEVRVIYTLENDKSIGLEYEAKLINDSADETFVSICNHNYWNIGSNSSSIDKTEVQVLNNEYLAIDETKAVTGKLLEADIKTFSSSTSTVLGASGPTFDHCFVVEKPVFKIDTRSNELKKVFKAYHPDTKIHFETYTTEPSFQLYTGDGVGIKDKKTGEVIFGKRSGLCVECCRYIDSGNFDEWKSGVLLKNGETYGSKTVYTFQSKDAL